jgi:hypothetical protein
MSVILARQDGADLRLNVWNWGVLHHVVATAGVLADEVWEPKRFNGGGTLERSDVQTLATFLRQRVLACLAPGERMLLDGTVTAEPDDGTFFRAEADLWRNYSLHHQVLVEVIEFLEAADGPVDFL